MSNRLNTPEDKADQIKLDSLKHKWYTSTPRRLYDLCIQTLVENINLLLVKPAQNECVVYKKKPKFTSSSTKYKIADHVGPLPTCISESLIKEYLKFYQMRLAELERDEYFCPVNSKTTAKKENLINYYDFLMAFINRPDKCSLTQVDYRQCELAQSSLEQRLKLKYQQQLANGHKIQTGYFKIIKNRSNSTFDLRSIRSRQKSHLIDKDLRSLVKNQNKLVYLDICPCDLSNKTIYYLNKHLTNSLKYLRLKNCCNWEKSNPSSGNNQQAQDQANENEFIFQFNNELSDLDSVDEDLELEEINNEQNLELNNFDFNLNAPRDQEENEDDDNFDAYLQEYVSRYEQGTNANKKTCRKHCKRHHKSKKCKKKSKQKYKLQKIEENKECKLFRPYKKAKHHHHHHHHHHKCKKSLKEKQINSKLTESQQTNAEASNQDKETSSILKWLVKRAVQNNSNNTNTTDSQRSSVSLIEHIKKGGVLGRD